MLDSKTTKIRTQFHCRQNKYIRYLRKPVFLGFCRLVVEMIL